MKKNLKKPKISDLEIIRIIADGLVNVTEEEDYQSKLFLIKYIDNNLRYTKEEIIGVLDLVKKVTKEQKEIVELKFVGLSFLQIAERLNMPEIDVMGGYLHGMSQVVIYLNLKRRAA